MPATLIVRNLGVSFGATTVLDDVSFTVGPGDRIGVVGPNGTGKTTLLRVISGALQPDRGEAVLSEPRATIGYVPQVRTDDPGELAIDAIGRRTGVAGATAAMERAAGLLGEGTDEAMERYADALEHWMALGGDDFEVRVATVTEELGLDPETLHRAVGELSGGEAARVALAAVLLVKADVVLLDEPTNDLDFAGLERLERFVVSRTGGIMVVSHDRAFLERTVNGVVELDEHRRDASVYAGGWLAYLDERRIARGHAEEEYAEYRKRREELESRANRQRQWSETGARKAQRKPGDHDSMQRGFRADRTEKLASKVRISERALERLDRVEKPFEGWKLDYRLVAGSRSGEVVFSLRDAVAERGQFRLGPVNLTVGAGDRIAIVGPNGSGKTTLLRLMLGELVPVQGSATTGSSVVIGRLDQGRDEIEGSLSLEESVGRELEALGHSRSEIRSLLAKFGLGSDHVDRPVRTLSPGERTRVAMARFTVTGVNTLVLDEPTNHLDLEAIEQLEQALEGWDGTLVLVTHDRRLLERVRLDRHLAPDGSEVEFVPLS